MSQHGDPIAVGIEGAIDAEAAARAVLARHQLSEPEPEHGDGPIESLRALRIARSSAVKAATASMNAIRSMIVTAPETLRTHLRGRSTTALLDACIALEPDLGAMTHPPPPPSSRYGHSPHEHANYAGKQTN